MTLEKWERTSPFGLLRFAYEYRVAARLVHDSTSPATYSMPAYSLMGQSIELALKSFLRARGMSLDDLQKIGHNLTKGLKRAREHGLRRVVQLHGLNAAAIDGLSEPYSSHRFRYIQNGMMSLPNWDHLDLTASLLISGLHDYAIRATLGREEGKRMLAQRPNCFPVNPKQP